MGYQYYGSYPYGVCFGVLCANAVSGFLEHVDIAVRSRILNIGRKTGKGGSRA